MNVNQRLMNDWRSSFHMFSLPFIYFIFINLIIGVLFRLLLVAQLPRWVFFSENFNENFQQNFECLRETNSQEFALLLCNQSLRLLLPSQGLTIAPDLNHINLLTLELDI